MSDNSRFLRGGGGLRVLDSLSLTSLRVGVNPDPESPEWFLVFCRTPQRSLLSWNPPLGPSGPGLVPASPDSSWRLRGLRTKLVTELQSPGRRCPLQPSPLQET